MLISITDNDLLYTTKTKIMVLSIDRSTWSATSIASQEYSESLLIRKSWYSDPRSFPLVDKENKIVYNLAAAQPPEESVLRLFKVDISDININEWNLQAYYTSAEKIPTTLTLSITPI